MIKLENLPLETLGLDYKAPAVHNKLLEKNIKTLQDLVDAMEKYPKTNWGFIPTRLKETMEWVEKSNAKGLEPIIYSLKRYDDPSVEYTDTLNKGSKLLLSTPTTKNSVRMDRVGYLSISDIKRFLTTTTSSGKTYLLYQLRGIGEKSIPQIVDAVDLYTDQVIRQSKLTPSRDENVFAYQRREKQRLVDDNYPEIIAYLIFEAKELVWGELTDSQKRMYLSSIINERETDKVIRLRMTRIIADYMTMSELDGISQGKYKVLDRFIKKSI